MVLRTEPFGLVDILKVRLSFKVKQIDELFFSFCQTVSQIGRVVSQKIDLVVDLKEKFW